MKFSLALNYGRFDESIGMDAVAKNALELVKIADQGGFDTVWTAEHHTIEVTASPNPFQILTHWAAHTKRRTGSIKGDASGKSGALAVAPGNEGRGLAAPDGGDAQ